MDKIMLKILWFILLAFLICPVIAYTDINEDLIIAVREGKEAEVKALLAKGTDVNTHDEQGFTPLMFATGFGHADIVTILLDAGADTMAKANNGMTALQIAEETDNDDIADILAAAGPSNIEELLLFTARDGDTEKVLFALANGASVNTKHREKGITALMLASGSGHIETMKVLPNAYADINARDDMGSNALMYAAALGQIDAVKILLENYAYIRTVNYDGYSALLAAKDEGHDEIAAMIEEADAIYDMVEKLLKAAKQIK